MNTATALVPEISNIRLMPTPKQVFHPDYFAMFIDDIGRKDSTIKGYTTCIHVFQRWLEKCGIVEPTKEDVRAYKDYLAAEGYKPGTQQQYLRSVKQFFKWCAAEGIYPNIAANVHGAKIRTDQHKKDALGREDVPAIAATIDRTSEQGKRLYAIYLLCITCALRTVEITRANVEDMKTVGGRTYLYIQGKGHDEKDAPMLLTPEVKEAIDDYLNSRTDKITGKSPLFVGTSNRGKPGAFKGYKKDNATGAIICDATTGEPVKYYFDGRIASTTISTMLKHLMQGAGYDSDRLTAHSLRHTSGTGAYKVTRNIYLTQQHARHCDPRTTEIYVHAEEREERDTEQQVYNYFFHQGDGAADALTEAHKIIDSMTPDKLEKALAVLRAMT